MDKIAELTQFPDKRNGNELIKKGEYKGLNYYIAFNGELGIPLAYVKIPKGHKWYGKDYQEIDLAENAPNWNLTFSDCYVPTIPDTLIGGWYIGWDYGHATDYHNDGWCRVIQGRVWTTEEIEDECKNVIEAIKKEKL